MDIFENKNTKQRMSDFTWLCCNAVTLTCSLMKQPANGFILQETPTKEFYHQACYFTETPITGAQP